MLATLCRFGAALTNPLQRSYWRQVDANRPTEHPRTQQVCGVLGNNCRPVERNRTGEPNPIHTQSRLPQQALFCAEHDLNVLNRQRHRARTFSGPGSIDHGYKVRAYVAPAIRDATVLQVCTAYSH